MMTSVSQNVTKTGVESVVNFCHESTNERYIIHTTPYNTPMIIYVFTTNHMYILQLGTFVLSDVATRHCFHR